jgi:hypothetical protein
VLPDESFKPGHKLQNRTFPYRYRISASGRNLAFTTAANLLRFPY